MSGEQLPTLLDCKALQAELGVRRATAERIMRAVPCVRLPDHRKAFVRRDDVLDFLERHTYGKDEVVPS